MTEIIRPGVGILFMKVGTHAQEDLAAIIARKQREIDAEGFAMWGYGGNTCHPRSMVQPFAEEHVKKGLPIYLVMQEMNSRHFAEPLSARRYSADGINWSDVPSGIDVRGSRFALVIEKLRQEEHVLPLTQTRVAVGPSRGRLGSRYIVGQADKACLEVLDQPELTNEGDNREVKINLVAELRDPYAVFLRSD
jgi:hypothetical protein